MMTPLCRIISIAAVAGFLTLSGCSGTTATNNLPADSITLSLTPSFITLPADGTTTSIVVSTSRSTGNTNSISLAVSGVPSGVSVNVTQPALGAFGTIFLTSNPIVIPGSYSLTITASDGTATSTATLATTLLPPDSITLVPSSNTIIVHQDATPATLPFTFARSTGNTNAITVSATGLPTGLTASFSQPGTGNTGSVTFTTSTVPATAGVYAVTLTASDGKVTTSTSISITIGVVLTVADAVDTSIGIAGHLQQFISTGFQPSTYNNDYFTTFPSTTALSAMNSLHLRLQLVVGAIPWTANSSPQAASDWSFTGLDNTVQPVLSVDDNSPIFQIAIAPGFLDDANGHFIYNATNLALLTTYAQNLVRYYNTGGFTWGGQHFQSPSSQHITWWAIFNEPNLNNITAAQYVSMYNTLVPAMLAIDPTLKFVALELSDFTGQPATFLPQLVQPAASGGINAPMNAIATHFYGTCVQATTDATLFNSISQFVTDINYFHTELATRSDLAVVPVWVTENNVNSDYPLPNGYSSCTPTTLYVLDTRATSVFFTAYRPLIFSRLGKAGNESLYHFLYEGSLAYGEVNSTSNSKTIAYWTDYSLQRTFPWDGVSTGALLYKTTTTEPTSTVDILAARNADNSVSLMVTDYATAGTTDNNGTGASRTVFVNLTALGNFSSATEVDLNSATPLTTGPASTTFTPASTLTLTFQGYGSSMFLLKP
jgi:hypothetical protein